MFETVNNKSLKKDVKEPEDIFDRVETDVVQAQNAPVPVEAPREYSVSIPWLRIAIYIVVFFAVLSAIGGGIILFYPKPQPAAPSLQQQKPAQVVEDKDSDGDGLKDSTERDLGTNWQNRDTDADELSDYEEVTVYKTDPLKADTDGDGFLDGMEVRGGYNPLGEGRLAR